MALDIGAYALKLSVYARLAGRSTKMTDDPRRTPADCNCLAIRQAARFVTQIYDRHLAPAGLRVSQFGILAMLRHKGPLTINELAAELVIDRTTLGRNILPLQRDGLIAVKAGAFDRRCKELRLSAAGEKRYRDARRFWGEAQAEFETRFGGERAAHLRSTLRDLIATAPQSADAAIPE